MSVSIEAASQIYREAIRNSVKRASLLHMVQAGLMVIAGVLAIAVPVISAHLIIVAIGWLLIISGVVQGIGLVSARNSPDAWLQLISIVLGMLIGFLILRSPAQSLGTLSLLVVVFFMMEGISTVVWALTIRPLTGWVWVFLSGLLGIVLSCLLIGNIESVGSWLLAVMVGAQLIVVGAAIGFLAWTARQSLTV